jgi:DNA primase large subunit
LDSAVIGDIKRLARIPFSVHEKTRKQCSPVSLSHRFIAPRTLDIYRDFGLAISILKSISKELKVEDKWREMLERKMEIPQSYESKKNRPCLQKALSLPLHYGEGHKIRLAIAVECLHKGFSVDQVVDLFRSQGDFNEKKTRYFVNDALKKGYKPFKCKTIQNLGFCLENCKKRDAIK